MQSVCEVQADCHGCGLVGAPVELHSSQWRASNNTAQCCPPTLIRATPTDYWYCELSPHCLSSTLLLVDLSEAAVCQLRSLYTVAGGLFHTSMYCSTPC